MKTYKAIASEMKTARAHIAELKELYNDSVEAERAYIRANASDKDSMVARLRGYDDEQRKLLFEIDTQKKGLAILRHNMKVAIFDEITPVFLGILNDYNGKRYGEKTKQKICDALYEQTGFYGYISNHHGFETITLCNHDYESIECGGVHENGEQKTILTDNVIKSRPFSDFRTVYFSNDYISDITEHITKMYAKRDEIQKKCEALTELVKEYNSMAVDGINHIEINNYGVREMR